MPEAASFDQHLAGAGRIELDLLDAPIGTDLPENGGVVVCSWPRTLLVIQARRSAERIER